MTHEEAAKAYPILSFFVYNHLPPQLQEISKPIGDLAWNMAMLLPQNAETAVGLRKLLESKDALVRARITAPPIPLPTT